MSVYAQFQYKPHNGIARILDEFQMDTRTPLERMSLL